MEEVNVSIKERLFNNLTNCLNQLIGYDVNTLMPLFYVLCAHHHGHLISIISGGKNIFTGERHIQSIENVDGEESALLKEIRCSVNERYFVGQTAEAIFNFYSYSHEYIDLFYKEIIEYIINYYTQHSGRYAGISVTPQEVAKLMAFLINSCNVKNIYDPCAGLCSYALLPELENVHFVGQELSLITKTIADIRIDASGKDILCKCQDSTFHWMGDDDFDCVASELPFGVKLNQIKDHNYLTTLEDFVLKKFLDSEKLSKAVLLVPMLTCKRANNFNIRKKICENNYIEMVIALPIGILSYTGVTSAIIILNKHKKNNIVNFIYADDCISLTTSKQKILDVSCIINRINDKDKEQRTSISVEETFKHSCSLDPSEYVTQKIDVLPGQKLVKFLDLCDEVYGSSNFKETKGRVLTAKSMSGNLVDIQDEKCESMEINSTTAHYLKITDTCVITTMRFDKFYIKDDKDPLFIPSNYKCFKVKQEKCTPKYIIYAITSFNLNYTSARINYRKLILPIYENIESQKNIVKRLYHQEQKKLQRKLKRLQILSGKSSDLIHCLGNTFTTISAGIAILRSNDDNEIVKSISDNVKFALRQINSTGNDFSFVKPEMEKVKLDDVLNTYLNGWNNYGYKTFDISPLKSTLPNDTKVLVDTELLFTLLDCIFINAHQHGFNKKKSEGNMVIVELKAVTFNEDEYAMISVSNNGNPLPDNFSLKDFISRGIVGINSAQDGIGGDHIYKIAQLFKGKFSIESDSDWLSFNVLLPIYITSSDIKFEEYECECL